jgi:hypothetical protein
MRRKSFLLFFVVSGLTLICFVGCDKDEVKVYRVEKEPVSSMPPMGNDLPPPPTTSERLEWTAPSNWEQKAPTPMRYGSFTISGKNGEQADLSVITLAGEAGGSLANINRWRDQLGLPPVSEAQFSKEHIQLKILDANVVLVDFASAQPLADKKNRTRILAAILPRGSSTWFFKMTGDDALVESQKSSFTQFLKSLRVSKASPPTPVPPVMAKMDGVPQTPMPISSGESALKWTLPAGWKEMPASGMRKGSFTVSGNKNMQADISIISLPGDVGGFLANVNRWRGQVSLPPLTDVEFSKQSVSFKAKGGDALLVDMLSPTVLEKKQYRTRIVGSILAKEGQCWFFKMMGDDALVESQKQIFTDFVKSVEIPHG